LGVSHVRSTNCLSSERSVASQGVVAKTDREGHTKHETGDPRLMKRFPEKQPGSQVPALLPFLSIHVDRFQHSEHAATEPEKVARPQPDLERPATVQTAHEAAAPV
jgi:hypothetical protein